MTPAEHEHLWQTTMRERTERMRRLLTCERDVLIRYYADKVIDLRPQFLERGRQRA